MTAGTAHKKKIIGMAFSLVCRSARNSRARFLKKDDAYSPGSSWRCLDAVTAGYRPNTRNSLFGCMHLPLRAAHHEKACRQSPHVSALTKGRAQRGTTTATACLVVERCRGTHDGHDRAYFQHAADCRTDRSASAPLSEVDATQWCSKAIRMRIGIGMPISHSRM